MVFEASWGLLNCGLCLPLKFSLLSPGSGEALKSLTQRSCVEQKELGQACPPARQAGRKLCGVTLVLVGNLLSCSRWGSGGGGECG